MTYSVNFANYTIGEDAYQNVREVCRHYGKKALLIGGEMALKAGKEKLIQALASEIQIVDTVLFGTDCTYARMEELAEHAKKCGADMIFGMGGGKALDTAKGTAEKAGLPVCGGLRALLLLYERLQERRHQGHPGLRQRASAAALCAIRMKGGWKEWKSNAMCSAATF